MALEIFDEAQTPTVQGMDDHGFSNSPAAPPHEPASDRPEVQEPAPYEPGFSNSLAVPAHDAPEPEPTVDLEPGHSNTGTDEDEAPTEAPPSEKSVTGGKVETKAITPADAENK